MCGFAIACRVDRFVFVCLHLHVLQVRYASVGVGLCIPMRVPAGVYVSVWLQVVSHQCARVCAWTHRQGRTEPIGIAGAVFKAIVFGSQFMLGVSRAQRTDHQDRCPRQYVLNTGLTTPTIHQ